MVKYCLSHRRVLTDAGWRKMTEEEFQEVRSHLFAKRADCDRCPVEDYLPRNYEATYTFVRSGMYIRQEGLRDEPADIPEAMLSEEWEPKEEVRPPKQKRTVINGLKKGAKKATRKIVRRLSRKKKDGKDKDK
jgi:hypothetical protein